jgi:hypothetical protein
MQVQMDGRERDLFRSVLECQVDALLPAERMAFEEIEDELVDALMKGEDVRHTFVEIRSAGEGKLSVGDVVEVARYIQLAWSTYSVFAAIWGKLLTKTLPPSTMEERLAKAYMDAGIRAEADARQLARIAAETIAKALQGTP